MDTSAPEAPAPSRPSRGGGLGVLGWVVIGGLAVVLAGGWAIIMANVGQTPGIQSQTVAWDVRDDSVQITYSVAKAKGDTVRCTVDAYDTDFAVLASHEITVPPGTSRITKTETLRTAKRATGARVKDCRSV
ncbi:DUF4307 domain-containing protein [Actinomadura hibisca]|uniref:DUF4307 domain-containing protein n=1 Tax=Actinomadura hibisca TaxID=68565 RepID=UPI000835812D|nr:DUF4307 domain-containing protein [Actinomadura hibisca]